MKPDFLSHPDAWLRTPRTHQSRAEYGCAVERPVDRFDAFTWKWVPRVIGAIGIATVAVVYLTKGQ